MLKYLLKNQLSASPQIVSPPKQRIFQNILNVNTQDFTDSNFHSLLYTGKGTNMQAGDTQFQILALVNPVGKGGVGCSW